MKLVLFQVHSPNFFIRHLPTSRVFPTIQTAGHLEPLGGRRARDQTHDRLIIAKRLAAPIRGDEGEQPVFNLVPARKGDVKLVRYADDCAALAKQMGTETIEFIESRLEGKFQLEINREKTRV